MNEYFENLNETIKEYFKVLSDEIPDFLYDYINTKPMQRIGKIGCGCGTDYTKIFNNIKPNNINTSIIMFLCLRFTMIILPNVYKVNISNVLLNSILKLSDNLLQPLSC